MAASAKSTKDQILALLDDIELISRDLLDVLTAGQDPTQRSTRVNKAIEALIQQEGKLKEKLVTARKQGVVQVRIDQLNVELDKNKQDIFTLQKNLKESETQLASAVWEAKRKLESIHRAEEKAVTVDELIRFSHRISSSGSIAAPPNWLPGDQSRRPYPTDGEIRQGLLNKNFDQLREAYHSQITQQKSEESARGEILSGYSWSSSLITATGAQNSTAGPFQLQTNVHLDETSDVGIMSGSDSSSSSSSDEQ